MEEYSWWLRLTLSGFYDIIYYQIWNKQNKAWTSLFAHDYSLTHSLTATLQEHSQWFQKLKQGFDYHSLIVNHQPFSLNNSLSPFEWTTAMSLKLYDVQHHQHHHYHPPHSSLPIIRPSHDLKTCRISSITTTIINHVSLISRHIPNR